MPYDEDDLDFNSPDVDGEPADDDSELLPCPSCGAMIYEETEKCPYCGEWVTPRNAGQRMPWWVTIGGIIAIVAFLFWVFRGLLWTLF